MNFKLNIISGIFGRRRGHLCVTQQGQITVFLRCRPREVCVWFTDPEPPIDPCNPVPPDELSYCIKFFGFLRWGVVISWNVSSMRQVEFKIRGILGRHERDDDGEDD